MDYLETQKTQWVIWKPKKTDNDNDNENENDNVNENENENENDNENVNDNKYIGAAAKASLLELL